jgi:hypothetical protein
VCVEKDLQPGVGVGLRVSTCAEGVGSVDLLALPIAVQSRMAPHRDSQQHGDWTTIVEQFSDSATSIYQILSSSPRSGLISEGSKRAIPQIWVSGWKAGRRP